jgi:hypothetical protein
MADLRGTQMATSLAPGAKHEDLADLPATTSGEPLSTRIQWVWAVFGLALIGAFLAFVVDDFPLRSLIATH